MTLWKFGDDDYDYVILRRASAVYVGLYLLLLDHLYSNLAPQQLFNILGMSPPLLVFCSGMTSLYNSQHAANWEITVVKRCL